MYKCLFAVAVGLGIMTFGYQRFRRAIRVLLATESDLPLGLPNPRNFCYLNALLQAMSTNASLVRFIRKRAGIHKSRLLYSLVCVLKGLRCSSQYIIANNLEGVLRTAYNILLMELSHAQNWSSEDQQDAHELFNFLMDTACRQSLGYTALKAREGLASFSQFLGPHYEQIAPRCFHRSRLNIAPNSFTIRSPLQTEVFQQHLLVSQVTCRNCDYRSSPVLQPESCLTVFFDSSSFADNSTVIRHSITTQKNNKVPLRSAPKLTDCLAKQFGTIEPLPDLHCPKCQTTDDKSSSVSNPGFCQQERWVAHLPSCLVLHVQRSAWIDRTGTNWNLFGLGCKRSDYVHFPFRLNMAKYMLSRRSQTSSSLGHQKNSGDIPMHNALSQLHARQPRTYVLRSVLVHQGESISSGHYITYRVWRKGDPSRLRRKPAYTRFFRRVVMFIFNFFHGIPHRNVNTDSPWVLTSDIHVLRVSGEEVRSTPAFLLFYELDVSVTKDGHDMSPAGSLTKLSLSAFDKFDDEYLQERSGDKVWDHNESLVDRCSNYPDDTDDEADDVDEEEFDELGDTGDELSGGSKADVIRACVLAASPID